ncbi:RND family efflux transporter MFP subunit, partial [mine drainage metagenome]
MHPGDRVQRGQILARVDSPELQNEYQRQLATLKSMNAALDQERVRLREQLINSQQQANLAAVRMNAQLRDLQRAQAAWRVHVISERRYETAYDTFSVARLDFENARDDAHLERQQILLSLRRRTLARDAQALRVAELKARADALTVRSPVTGLVAQTLQPDQSYVAENAPLVRVVDLKALAIRFQVAESLANGIVPGVPAEITLGVKPSEASSRTSPRPSWMAGSPGRARFDGAAPSGLRQNEQASVRII